MPEQPEEQPQQPKSRARIVAIALAVAAVAAAGIGIAARSRSEQRLTQWTEAQAVPTVSVIAPKVDGGDAMLTLPANLRAFNTAPIYARTNGYVGRWLVDIGDKVARGQLLATLEAPELEQQLAAARADLKTAEANERLARTTAERWRAMLAKDAVSRQETDEKQGDLAARSAIADAARANVARLQATMDFTRLRAPFGGVVTSRTAELGALVTAGNSAAQPLFTVSDVSRMRAYVRVPQTYASQIRQGMQVELILPEYPGQTFAAELTRLAGAVDPGTGTMLVELQAANEDRALRPGSFAQARFPLAGGGKALAVPPSALLIDSDGARVALLGADGKAHFRPVTIGRDRGTVVEISKGIAAGDKVIDSPPDSLREGDRVQVLEDKPEKGGADAPAKG